MFIDAAQPYFYTGIPLGPPRELLVDIPLPRRFDWLKSLLCSMPRNSEITQWSVRDTAAGFNNLPALASCALESHRNLGCVQSLVIGLQDSDATWAQLASLLNDPGIRGFSEIIVSNTSVSFRNILRYLYDMGEEPTSEMKLWGDPVVIMGGAKIMGGSV